MFVRLIKLNERQRKGDIEYYLTEVSINIMQISYISENYQYKRMLSEGKLNLEINKGAQFTDLQLNTNQTITVIGTPSVIETKILSNTNKQLLKG
tara:strand:+ start:951 stop:1235 length:285 start_codon:yes stop_codon:yes gene_type:complete